MRVKSKILPAVSAVLSLLIVFSTFASALKVLPFDPVVVEPAGMVTVRYNFPDRTVKYHSTTAIRLAGNDIAEEGKAITGWATEPGGPIAYDEFDTIQVDESGAVIDLYPVYTDLCVKTDEIFSFSNSDGYFNPDDKAGYKYTAGDYIRLIAKTIRNFAVSPLFWGALPVAAVIASTPSWEFGGSCYGMSLSVALNHLGIEDLASANGAECLHDLEATTEVISNINCHQMQCAESYFTEHFALGNEETELKALYESSLKGRPVMLTYGLFKLERKDLLNIGKMISILKELTEGLYAHTILVTGAYTEKSGRHVLLVYDCNSPSRYTNNVRRVYIESDYSEISIGDVNWTDDYDHYLPFLTDSSDVRPWVSALKKG